MIYNCVAFFYHGSKVSDMLNIKQMTIDKYTKYPDERFRLFDGQLFFGDKLINCSCGCLYYYFF